MNATTRDNGGLRQRDLDALARAEHANPFAVLGPHADGAGGLFVRAFLPTALNVRCWRAMMGVCWPKWCRAACRGCSPRTGRSPSVPAAHRLGRR